MFYECNLKGEGARDKKIPYLTFFNSPIFASSRRNSSIWFLSNLFLLVIDDFRNILPGKEKEG